MIAIRKSTDRGTMQFSWLDTKHTFSFGHYYDPGFMGFGPLRVINEDVVKGGGGFPEHPHNNMEIVTYILSGALEHKDSMGNGGVIRPGDIQRMSAGSGITHSEFNPSATESCHLLQIWLLPEKRDIEPGYEQKSFDMKKRQGDFQLLVSKGGRENSVNINQDADMYAALLNGGEALVQTLAKGRLGWIQVAKGSVSLNGQMLEAGDGAGITGESEIILANARDAEIVLFDMAGN